MPHPGGAGDELAENDVRALDNHARREDDHLGLQVVCMHDWQSDPRVIEASLGGAQQDSTEAICKLT